MVETRKYWSVALKIIGVLVGAGLLTYLFTKIDTEKTFQLITGIGISVGLIFIPYILVSAFDTVGWKIVFPNPKRAILFQKLLSIRFITEAMLMSIPAGVAVAESMKPLLLKKYLQIPASEGVASVAVKKMLFGAAQGVYLILSVAFGFYWMQASSKSVIGMDGLPWMILGVSVVLIVFFGVGTYAFVNGAIARRLHSLLLRVPFSPLRSLLLRQEEKFVEVDAQLKEFNSLGSGKMVYATLAFTLSWLMEAVETFVILWVLGVDLSFAQVLAFETILSFVRSLIFFVPAGLGVQDLGYVAFFTALGVPDPMTIGGAFILLKRFKELIWIIIGYLILFVSGVRLKEMTVQTS
ncbi:MAG: flippase-like domain-containing protein [Chlorobiales bacterium]|nr:flippase-like domain-containing protein [Chlorobiales bacterium]